MPKMFKRLSSLSLFFSLLLLLMVACADDDYETYDPPQAPVAEESAAPAPEEPTPEPATEPAPEPTPAPPPVEGELNLDDTCILWKPVSEGDHKLVVLLPGNYGAPEVFVLDKQGNVVEQGRFVGITNGGRATYRFGQPGRNYPPIGYLQVGGTKYKYTGPSARHSC